MVPPGTLANSGDAARSVITWRIRSLQDVAKTASGTSTGVARFRERRLRTDPVVERKAVVDSRLMN